MINNKGYFIEVWYRDSLIGYLGTNPADGVPRTRYKLPTLSRSPLRYRDWVIAQQVINLAEGYGNTKLEYHILKPKSCTARLNLLCRYPKFTTVAKVQRERKPKKTREEEFKAALTNQVS